MKTLSNAPQGFQTLQEVVNIQNKALSIVSGGIKTEADKEGRELFDRIKKAEIEKLEQLKNTLFSLEQEFYAKIGISGYKDLYFKTIQWKKSGAASILQNPKIISDIQAIFADTSTADLEQIVLSFSDKVLTKEQLIEIFGEEINELAPEAVSLISASLKGAGANKKGTLTMSFATSNKKEGSSKKQFIKSTKTKGITFFQRGTSSKNKAGNFEIHFTQDIPMNLQKKMTNQFFEILKNQDTSIDLIASSQLYQKISQKILSYLPSGSYPKANQIIARTVESFIINQQQIAISKNSSVIRGALGEIYWNAFFDFLGVSTIPVGFDVHDDSGKEIPIDIAFEKFGFQVKNYQVSNGIVTFNQHFDRKLKEMVPNKIPLSRFFSRGLELGESASEDLGKFYFSREYNRRNPKLDEKNEYKAVESRFDPIYGGINTFIEANLPKLLNMDKNISLQHPELFNIELNSGRPIIFFINENPFPASEMIQEIINGLSNSFSSDVYINIKNLVLDLSSFKTTQKWDEAVEPNVSQRLKQGHASYTIDVHISNLLEKILNKAS